MACCCSPHSPHQMQTRLFMLSTQRTKLRSPPQRIRSPRNSATWPLPTNMKPPAKTHIRAPAPPKGRTLPLSNLLIPLPPAHSAHPLRLQDRYNASPHSHESTCLQQHGYTRNKSSSSSSSVTALHCGSATQATLRKKCGGLTIN